MSDLVGYPKNQLSRVAVHTVLVKCAEKWWLYLVLNALHTFSLVEDRFPMFQFLEAACRAQLFKTNDVVS